MTFNKNNFTTAGGQSSRGSAAQLFTYITTDASAIVVADGYFNNIRTMLSKNDVIIAKVAEGFVIIQVTLVPTNGAVQTEIQVEAQSLKTLSELSDVNISSVADKELLVYNSITQKWENKTDISVSKVTLQNPLDGSDWDIVVNTLGELVIGDTFSDFDRIKIQTSGNVVMSNNVSAANLSGTNTGDQDLSGLVPYTGATQNVNLGTNQITASRLNVGTDTIIDDNIDGVENITANGIIIGQTGIASGGNITAVGNITATGTMGASNLSGTNTGDHVPIEFSATNSAAMNLVEDISYDPVILDEVLFNRGGGYNPATGIFTAPEDGTYYIGGVFYAISLVGNSRRIIFSILTSGGNPSGATLLDVNGFVAPADNYTGTGGALFELDQNDTVSFRCFVAGAGGGVPGQPYQLRSQANYFFGYKLP